MSLQIKNSRELIHPDKFKAKILLVAPPGFGKTTFLGGVPDIGVAACETGDGCGLLPIAQQAVDYVTPTSLPELEAVVSGIVFKNKTAQGLDSATAMVNTFIREFAVAIPQSANTPRRAKGVPDQKDYGVMTVIFQQLLQKLLLLDKHIIVTSLLRINTPDSETGIGSYNITPQLPGQMQLGAPAMFDIVLVGRTREAIKEVDGKKVRSTERYWITEPDPVHIVAKCRPPKLGGGALLSKEEPYDVAAGLGTFPYLFEKMRAAYAEIYERLVKQGG